MSLQWMIAGEQYRDILDQLTPRQLVVVALKLEFGLSDIEIAQEIGLTKQAVGARIREAGKQIAVNLPHLAYEANRRKLYNRPLGDEITLRELDFIRALVEVEMRGEMVTLAAIKQELGLGRNMIYRTFQRLQTRGLVAYGPRAGNANPLHLTPDRGLNGGSHAQT